MRPVLVLLAVLLAAAALRFWRLDVPPRMVFDEIYYAKAARQYLADQEITEEITHPPLSKLLIALGMRVFGDEAFGWRVATAAAGAALILMMFLLAAAVTSDRVVAVTAAALMTLDGLAFVESRIAKPDVFLVLFLTLAYWGFWLYVRRGSAVWAYLSGVAIGCALATKWTAAPGLLIVALTAGYLAKRGRWKEPTASGWLHLTVAYAVIPLAVYIASWTPYLLRHTVRELASFHWFMFTFHAGLQQGHPYQSQWWSWPLLLRPIWYDFKNVGPSVVQGILAIGNPILWWASLAALGWAAWRAVRARDDVSVFIVVGFLVSYLPYAFIGRALFLYHLFPALPFMLLALALALDELRRRIGAAVPLIYGAAAAAWFIAYYPVLSALPLAQDRFYRLMWFGTWI